MAAFLCVFSDDVQDYSNHRRSFRMQDIHRNAAFRQYVHEGGRAEQSARLFKNIIRNHEDADTEG